DGIAAAVGGAASGQDLGEHATGADAASGTAGHGFKGGIAGLGGCYQSGRWILAGIRAVQTRLVGKNNKGFGFDEVGYQGAEGVIVAKTYLVGDDGIVLVDDGHDSKVEQGVQGAAGIEITLSVGQIFVCEKNLRCAQAMPRESNFVSLDETHLADRCRSLQLVHGMRATSPSQSGHALGNGAAGNKHHLLALGMQRGYLGCPFGDRSLVKTSTFVGDK